MIFAKWKLWIIGGLALALAGTLYQCRAEVQNAAQWSLGFDQLQEQINRADERAREIAERHDRERELQRTLSDELRMLRDEQRRMEREFQDLENRDEQVAEWADIDLPRALIERMRDDRASGGDGEGD